MSPRLQAGLLALLLPLVATWPMAARVRTHLPFAPEYEGAAHAWGLWAALREGAPIVVHTGLVAAPDGLRFVLVDPLHLLPYALGQAVAGVGGGVAALTWLGLAVAGLAGALLAEEVEGDPRLGALAAMCCTPVLAAGRDGITEDLAIGWVGVQLALLLRYARTGDRRVGVAAGLSLAAAWYGGPYNGLLAALVDLGPGLAWLLRGDRQRAGRAAQVALLALLLTLPLAVAVLWMRPDALPGSAARGGLPALDPGPDRFRGGLQAGADLLDPWLPAPLTGGVAAVPHSAYLGIVALGAASLAVRRDRRRWPWLAGALGLTLLALGPHLYLAGQPVQVGGRPLLGPAGVLALAVPAAARLTRWYRAAGAAALLLAPLVARSARRPAARAALAAGLLLDAALLAPLPWPRPSSPLPDAAFADALAQAPPGALLELPLSTAGTPAPGAWRDVNLLDQIAHGRPIGGGVLGLPPSEAARRGQRLVLGTARGAPVPEDTLQALRRAGFATVALRLRYLALGPAERARLARCLGPPLLDSSEVAIHLLPDTAGPCGEGVPADPR